MAKKVAKKKATRKTTRKKATRRTTAISPGVKKRPVGRPPFKPTAEDRKRVETLAGLGIRQDDICLLVLNPKDGKPITGKTLRRHFEHELAAGAPKANALVAESLFKRATSGEGKGAVTAAIYWTKVRMGWKERSVVEVETKSGVLVPPPAVSPEEWIAAANKRAEGAKEPGAKNGNGDDD